MTGTELIGVVFGRLTVIMAPDKKLVARDVIHCLCECGTNKSVCFNSLAVRCCTKSCGCWKHDAPSVNKPNLRHGCYGTKEYTVWVSMLARCKNKTHPAYERYGGRGINVCERWQDFAAFFSDMGNRPSNNHSIDRIDNNGDYKPGNCRWATKKEQAENRERTLWFEHDGQKMTLSDWARKTGIKEVTLRKRISMGLSIKDAIETPIGAARKLVVRKEAIS